MNGKALRSKRLEAGLTQEQLARTAGVTLVTVARLEADRHSPKLSTAQKLADALGIPLSDLLTTSQHAA